MKKIVISLTLFALLIGCNEANTPSTWSGKADTKWYKKSKSEFTIKTAEQLAGFAALVNDGNNFSGKTVKLGQNIMLNDTADWQDWENNPPANEWMPIGNHKYNLFQGTFDGNGFAVNGIYIGYSENSQGLFGNTSSAEMIENLDVAASYIKGKEFINGTAFTITTFQQQLSKSESYDNNLNLTAIISKEHFEIWARGGSLPKILFREMNAYDELAETLAMIHNRFIDSPDADNITVAIVNEIDFKIVYNVMNRAKTAGFSEISLAKIEEEELRKYEEERKKKREKKPNQSNQKIKVSEGAPGKIGDALGKLMGEQMQKEQEQRKQKHEEQMQKRRRR